MSDVHPPHEVTHRWHEYPIRIATIALSLLITIDLVMVQAMQAQTAQKQEFDVASVKLNTFGAVSGQNPPMSNVDLDPGDIFVPTGGIFSVRNKSLRTLIAFAYKMSGDQQNFLKLNVPDFVLTERFDIEARTTETHATKDDYRAMMASLLTDRFKLKVHNETRDAKIYALIPVTPGKLGSTIRMHPAGDKTCDSPEALRKSPRVMPDGFPALCGTITGIPPVKPPTETRRTIDIGGRNIPMSLLAAALVAPYTGDTGLEHAVVDKTGITGTVDFTLSLGYDEMESTNTPNTGPLFLQELKDQLGMKLRPDKGTINIYVVDHVEHLTEN